MSLLARDAGTSLVRSRRSIVLSQQDVCKATIKTLKNANTVINRAKKYRENCGLYFPRLELPLKEVAVHDSSHATKDSVYAQEGVLILLMHDRRLELVATGTPQYKKLEKKKRSR